MRRVVCDVFSVFVETVRVLISFLLNIMKRNFFEKKKELHPRS